MTVYHRTLSYKNFRKDRVFNKGSYRILPESSFSVSLFFPPLKLKEMDFWFKTFLMYNLAITHVRGCLYTVSSSSWFNFKQLFVEHGDFLHSTNRCLVGYIRVHRNICAFSFFERLTQGGRSFIDILRILRCASQRFLSNAHIPSIIKV